MIRPVTLVCFLLACGSGLYLYSAKHRVQLVDHEIEKTVHATDELREQIRVLHAEWTLQNDPQRLQALADQFLSLKTLTPGQFTSLADLDKRLPAVPAPEPTAPEAEPQPVPVAQAPLRRLRHAPPFRRRRPLGPLLRWRFRPRRHRRLRRSTSRRHHRVPCSPRLHAITQQRPKCSRCAQPRSWRVGSSSPSSRGRASQPRVRR
jgi:hypothetical protein